MKEKILKRKKAARNDAVYDFEATIHRDEAQW